MKAGIIFAVLAVCLFIPPVANAAGMHVWKISVECQTHDAVGQ